MKVDNLINEELKRFASINNYVGALEESMVGGLAGVNSGFMDDQGDSERLKTFRKRQMDMAEQEEGDELEEPIEDLELPDEVEGDEGEEVEGEEEELDLETGDEDLDMGMEEEGDSDVEELDVTDIVTMTKETGEKADTVSKEISTQSKRIEDLIGKLDSLENQLGDMDKIINQMNNLETKFEDLKPATPQEKLELRSLDSGPFTQKPHEFWDEKNAELAKQPDKHEYVLTADEVADYNETDIKNSWVADEEEEEEEQISVLGNKA